MPHLPNAHHETSKHDSPSKTKIKEKQIKTIPASNSNLAKSMTHHNQTKELTTWILNLSLDESIPLGFSISPLMGPLTTKVQSLKFKSKTP
jgi:hypothetical protein